MGEMTKLFHEDQTGSSQPAHDSAQGYGKGIRSFLIAEAFDASEHKNET
jgi:hypothetical protein